MRLNQLINNNVVIGIAKDSRGPCSHNQASIDISLCVIANVHRLWFVFACFGHQNGVDAIVILLLLIRVESILDLFSSVKHFCNQHSDAPVLPMQESISDLFSSNYYRVTHQEALTLA
jgi:hypothetical protein